MALPKYFALFIRALVLVSGLVSTFASFAMPSTNTVKLSHQENSPSTYELEVEPRPLPPMLFLHGLDSSSHTWRNTLGEIESKAVALDLRGCGHSPLGDPQEFSPQGIVNDIHAFLCSHRYFQKKDFNNQQEQDGADDDDDDSSSTIVPFVIVGHSMGGRIAMSFASQYPELVKALVIEDMDIRTRPMEMNIFQSNNREATIVFDKNLGNKEESEMVEIFEKEGYPSNSVSKWLREGRIEQKEDGSYYSQVNPAFRLLCYEQFFITDHGEKVWNELGSQSNYRFPIHVMVADKDMTVCDENSIWDMKIVMTEKGKFMVMHRYKNATHSIHNSSSKDFLKDLRSIIRAASLGQAKRSKDMNECKPMY
mmetsp:Transcript_4314/g.6574  ORF Transcript_4314/g.6574 Transcript_4314/m.6574 type:complete len:366 (-) Transcript_4314:24-1121(-)